MANNKEDKSRLKFEEMVNKLNSLKDAEFYGKLEIMYENGTPTHMKTTTSIKLGLSK